MLEQLLEAEQNVTEDEMYINVEPFHFEMIVLKKGRFHLYNTFEYFTKEDFIYFVLFVVEQLKLNPETLTVNLTGHIVKDDDLYQLLYTYIRHVEFKQPSEKFSFDDSLQVRLKHQYSLILNSFS